MIVYGIWHNAPFSFVVFYAGLQTVPQDTVESAMVDGASRWERIRFVIIPHLMPLATFVALVQLMDNFRVFEPIVGFSAEANATSLSLGDLQRSARPGRRAVRLGRRHLDADHPRRHHPAVAGADAHLARIQPYAEGGRRHDTERAQTAPAARDHLHRLRHPLGGPRRLPLHLDGVGLVQGRAGLLLPRDLLETPSTACAPSRRPASAFTGDGYYGAWITRDFLSSVINTLIVTVSVVVISLTFGTLGGYALARSGHRYTFWILMAALVFRAMPHITLVSGYLLPFFEMNIWGYLPTAIIVLVAINQPFTLWMLHSFFLSIPKDLDESAMVDGCSRFQAFRMVVIPVMWPGVITTGLFSFLLAYNDFAVTAMLLSQPNQTMVPKIASFLGTVQQEGNVMFAVAAVVSATAPLFMLVMFFQRQIVSGLTAGAVKG